MVGFSYVATLIYTDASYSEGITDLDIHNGPDGLVLLATSRSAASIISYGLASGQSASALDLTLLQPGSTALAPLQLEFLEDGSGSQAVIFGLQASTLPVFTLGAGGQLSASPSLSGAPANLGSLINMTSVEINGITYIYANHSGSTGIVTYHLTGGDTLTYDGQVGAGGSPQGADISDFASVDIAGQTYLLAASAYDNQLISYAIDASGQISQAGEAGAEWGLGIAQPTALATAVIGGVTYVVMAASGSSSISVLEMQAGGQLRPVDHIVDDLNTRFQSVTVLETIQIGERAYVVAGGGDDGLSLFELLPGGQLLHLQSLADSLNTTLANVSAIALEMVGGQIQLFVTSETETGITQFTIDTGTLGSTILGTASDETLNGSADNDLISGGAGNDQLFGLAGDDILIDGAGSDGMTGGAGADIFILQADGEVDTIYDFDPGEDRIDLTQLPFLRDISQLEIITTATGAELRFRGEVIIIHTANNQPLSAADIASLSLIELSRFPVANLSEGEDLTGTPNPDVIDGGIWNDTIQGLGSDDILSGLTGDDIIEGGAGDDTLIGGDGDDLLNGGAGADLLDGGAGTDTVSYQGSVGSLRVDLMFPHINTNIAAGDTYVSIENLIGSQGFDNLRGTLGDNLIQGMANVDYIFGRRGDDTLEGGVGDDVLFGGVGADILRGGSHRDRAQYSESLTALVLDLANPGLNTGEAAGDSYFSIEDLAGGRFDDHISGDAGVNRLFGREGADQLFGRDGNDYLNGGAHNDTLDGGAGDDVLRGGHNMDTFVFNAGADIVEDFADDVDTLRLHDALWGGASLSTAEILAMATVVGADTVFDFGGGNTLTLQNFTNIAALGDDIVIY